MTKLSLTAATIAVAALALTLGAAVPASAATSTPTLSVTPTLTCLGSTTSSYSPGLTNQPRTVTVRSASTFAPCVGVPAGYTATASLNATRRLSCTDLLDLSSTGSSTLRWSKGGASVFSYTRTATRNELTTVVTFTGTITSGQFTGATVVETATALNTDLNACQTSAGLTTLGYTEQLVVTGLLS